MNKTIALRYDSVNSTQLVPFHSHPLFNDPMEIKAIRRRNLLALQKQFGTFEKLAEAVDTSPSVFSQIKTHKRNLGHALARQIEAKLGKPEGWMDVVHNDVVLEEPFALYSVTASLQSRILKVFDWLTPEQQEQTLRELEATAKANQAAAKIFSRRISTATDHSVEKAFGKPGEAEQ